VRVPRTKIQTVEGHEVVHLRDRVIPVIRLASVLDSPMAEKSATFAAQSDQIYIVVLGLGEQRVGLAVERLLGQEEVVIKSLGEYLQSVPGIAGSTILGDGRVALIVDVSSLMGLIYGTVT
ncbi:MAG: chemotaxis protein CheW, partial [Planctomycetes bacterium]|nr:chemotaxis protein CheW [Planctomycetota bacterium]